MLAKIKNQNIVGYVDYFESDTTSFLVIEFCNDGDLEKYINSKPNKRVSLEEAVQFYKQLLNGFKSFHEFNIIHRDLKLPNIIMHNG